MPLEILKADGLPHEAHGFFTRKGGVSSGLYAGLNCGQGSSDLNNAVSKNRQLVAGRIGVEPQNLCSVHQFHSAEVVRVEKGHTPVKADAMVTTDADVALGILTADCAPVLFCDADAGVVGAAHSGWKGALGGIIGNTVDAMVALGATRERIRAAVGPCISQSNYEVGQEFMEDFVAQDAAYTQYFAGGPSGKPMFNLPHFVLHRLYDAGIEQAEWGGHCTYADEDRFYSYRRSTHRAEPDYGRLISVIRL